MDTVTKLLAGCIILAILISASFNRLSAQVKATRISAPEDLAGKSGIVYNLPGTIVHADIRIAKTRQFAGPLAQYAADYLGVDNVITKDAVSYSIFDAAIRTVTEPDPGQVFIIEKEEKSPAEIWISFGNQSPVAVIEKFEKGAAPAGFVKWQEDLFINPDPAYLFRKYTDSPTREVVDTIIRKVSIDTLVIEQKIFKSSMVEFSDVEKAQEAAAQIRLIDHDKYNLLIGYQETPYTHETLEFMLDQLEKQRQEYLKLFTGVSVTETLLFDFPVFPESGNEDGNYTLAGFSKTAGIIEAGDENAIILNIKRDDQGLNMSDVKDGQTGAGLVYRVPQIVTAILSFQGKELVSERIGVLQLSPLLSLPSGFKRVEFDMQTGAIKTVVLE